ncbi:hypothetical protein HGA88_02795 [Candidatus Roizmanbacteria bacterium]|nr:hypothetical protein [Candidatus Roizmanbacteria bacterium]
MRTEDKYNSNEWLIPIGEKAKELFSGMPKQMAIDATSTILIEEDGGNTELPWTTVFLSDDIDDVLGRLLTTFKTPDYETPAYNTDLRPVINDLKMILNKGGAFDGQFSALQASYELVRIAADKPNENFLNYIDFARRYSQYSGSWKKNLIKQFGRSQLNWALKRHEELALLLEQSEDLEIAYTQPDLMRKGESVVDFIVRGFESLNISDVASIETASKLLDTRIRQYELAAYNLRGIPLVEEK